jgi:hypothetical protein
MCGIAGGDWNRAVLVRHGGCALPDGMLVEIGLLSPDSACGCQAKQHPLIVQSTAREA